MTRIGLLSDTHIPVDAKLIPEQIKELFQDVDLILHAGDIYLISVLDELERIAPVLAARGDDDDLDITKDSRVKEKHNITVDGVEITLAHIEPGFGPWAVFPYIPGATDPGNYHFETVSGIIVCGHAHIPKVVDRGGYLFINPGSPTFPLYVHRLGTVALLTLNSGGAEVNLIQLQ